jgi:RNA polymerase sigma factor (sigma-70 family)
MVLTKEQQQIVVDNEKLIYHYMHRKGLDFDAIEDYYGLLAWTLCKCAVQYDPECDVKFSVYVYRSFDNNIKHLHRKPYPDTAPVSIYDLVLTDADTTILEWEKDPHNLELYVELKNAIIDAYEKLSPVKQKIIDYYIEGNTFEVIGRMVGRSRQYCGKIFVNFVNEVRENTDINIK